jgi:N-acetyl sugar amidotransferase
MTQRYQICNRCVMDTSDPDIVFDNEGNCNHCSSALELGRQTWFPDENGERKLQHIVEKIKYEERNNEFDCIIGLSGGVDSSYLAWFARKLGLRALVVHVDCGWNSELAVKNIENIVKQLNIELHTFVVNWEEIKSLQRSFFKASLPDQDIPQDHAIFSALYKFAVDNKIKYAFNGYNFATESIMPDAWGHQAMDFRHIKSVHKHSGEPKLKDYPHLTFLKRYLYYKFIKRMTVINPLNYIDYRKEEAIKVLNEELGWQYYGEKHYESRFTKFFQSYYLPVKFGFDKRRAHLSSLIVSGQITRQMALEKIRKSPYTESEIENDLEYVAKKLNWSPEEFRNIINLPPASHEDFASDKYIFDLGLKIKRIIS